DLWHKKQDLSPLIQDSTRGMQVDLGLATARHTAQQDHPMSFLPRNALHRLGLFSVELRPCDTRSTRLWKCRSRFTRCFGETTLKSVYRTARRALTGVGRSFAQRRR